MIPPVIGRRSWAAMHISAYKSGRFLGSSRREECFYDSQFPVIVHWSGPGSFVILN